MRRLRGFTLIEVMVAMAILAVAMAALTSAAGNVTNNSHHLRNRTIGLWVAENRLTEIQTSADWIRLGTKDGEMEMAGQVWYWRTIVEKVADQESQKYMRAVTIEVRTNPDQKSSSARLFGFAGNPRIKK